MRFERKYVSSNIYPSLKYSNVPKNYYNMKTRRGSIRLTEQDLVKLVKELNVKTKNSPKTKVLATNQK